MAKVAKRIRASRATRNPGSPGESSESLWKNAGAGAGAYATGRLAGRLVKAILASKSPGLRKSAKVLTAVGGVVAAHYMSRNAKFRKYRVSLMTGALINLIQAVVEELVPGFGNVLDLAPGLGSLGAMPGPGGQRRRIQEGPSIAQQLAAGRRVTLPSTDDAYFDRLEEAENRRRGVHQAPTPQTTYAPPPSQRAVGDDEDGPSQDDDGDEDFGAGIFGG